MSPVTIEIEGLSLTLPEHTHPLVYLARVFEIGTNEPRSLRLSANIDDCYVFLDDKATGERYGDIVVYDIQFVSTRKPIKVKTLPSRRMPNGHSADGSTVSRQVQLSSIRDSC